MRAVVGTCTVARIAGFVGLLIACVPGCDPNSPLARPFLLPPASIDWQQREDRPNFTVSFDLSAVVSDPARVTQVNWVFGDGGGFVPAGLQTEHRYDSAGSFNVVAYLFDADGFLDSLAADVRITVPTIASGPIPENTARDVRADSMLSWTPGNGATRSVLTMRPR